MYSTIGRKVVPFGNCVLVWQYKVKIWKIRGFCNGVDFALGGSVTDRTTMTIFDKRNPTYRRHWVYRRVRIIAPITIFKKNIYIGLVTFAYTFEKKFR